MGRIPVFTKLEVFQTSIAMARHAGARQAVIARNIANSDTPGYRAQTIASFRDHFDQGTTLATRATRPGHMTVGQQSITPRVELSTAEPAPNGNSVSIEQEMAASVEVQREHSRALGIYKHSLDLLRSSLGRR